MILYTDQSLCLRLLKGRLMPGSRPWNNRTLATQQRFVGTARDTVL